MVQIKRKSAFSDLSVYFKGLFPFLMLFSLSANGQSKTFSITGKVQRSFEYCGGARPSQELLDNLHKPQPFAGKKFYLRRGGVNSVNAEIVKSFETDSLGMFKLSMPPGTYSIILEEQLNKVKP